MILSKLIWASFCFDKIVVEACATVVLCGMATEVPKKIKATVQRVFTDRRKCWMNLRSPNTRWKRWPLVLLFSLTWLLFLEKEALKPIWRLITLFWLVFEPKREILWPKTFEGCPDGTLNACMGDWRIANSNNAPNEAPALCKILFITRVGNDSFLLTKYEGTVKIRERVQLWYWSRASSPILSLSPLVSFCLRRQKKLITWADCRTVRTKRYIDGTWTEYYDNWARVPWTEPCPLDSNSIYNLHGHIMY